MTESVPELPLAARIRYGAEAAGFFFLMGIFRLLGIDRASALGGFIGREVLYRTPLSTRARENLRAAFPEKSAAEIETIIREMWDNLGRTGAEYPHLDKISMLGSNPRIEVVGVEISDAAVAGDKGTMLFSGHFGNWEAMPLAASQRGYEGGIVYRPVNNPYVDHWISRQRARGGPKEQITKGAQGTRRIFNLLRKGKAVFLLVDQKTNEGVSAGFFGRAAMTTPAPAVLHLRLGASLVPVVNERLDGARFRVTIHPPITFTPTGDNDRDVQALTEEINRTVERLVRLRPSQWLWIHRRWPREKDKPTGRRWRAGAQEGAGSADAVEREGSSRT